MDIHGLYQKFWVLIDVTQGSPIETQNTGSLYQFAILSSRLYRFLKYLSVRYRLAAWYWPASFIVPAVRQLPGGRWHDDGHLTLDDLKRIHESVKEEIMHESESVLQWVSSFGGAIPGSLSMKLYIPQRLKPAFVIMRNSYIFSLHSPRSDLRKAFWDAECALTRLRMKTSSKSTKEAYTDLGANRSRLYRVSQRNSVVITATSPHRSARIFAVMSTRAWAFLETKCSDVLSVRSRWMMIILRNSWNYLNEATDQSDMTNEFFIRKVQLRC